MNRGIRMTSVKRLFRLRTVTSRQGINGARLEVYWRSGNTLRRKDMGLCTRRV